MEPVSKTVDIIIELGDIIQIDAPNNSDLHTKIFLVSYIDNKQIHIIDNKDLVKHIININDGMLTDQTIQSISILYKHPEKGYSRQHGLIKDVWITIEFGGDVPTIITGKITNLEEDMIELQTYPEKETIYIDFGYKGIPLDLPIKNIKIRPEPIALKEVEPSTKVEPVITEEGEGAEPDEDIIIDENLIGVSTREMKTRLRQVIMDADDIVFGEELGEVDEVVDVGEKQRRYGIDTQTNDLMDEMLSTIPNAERTRNVLNRIHILIERFKQLREQFSKFDESGNADKKERKDSNYKPSIEVLKRLSRNLNWIIPVVKNNKKVYDLIDEEESLNVVNKQLLNELTGELDTLENNEMDYDKQVSQQTKYRTPFEPVMDDDKRVLSNIHVESDIDCVVSSLENMASTVIQSEMAKSRKYVINRYNLGVNRLKMTSSRGSSLNTEDYAITKSDLAQVTGFIVMPSQYIKFSGVKLPGNNIYNKVNLSQARLNYWQVLNEMITPSVLTHYVIKYRDEEQLDVEDDELIHYFKNVFINTTDGDTIQYEKDKYTNFLRKVIPKTKFLFNLISKYIANKVSYENVLQALEPFAIYKDDVTFNQYEEIAQFVHDNIIKYRQNYERSKVEFLKKRNAMNEEDNNVFINDKYYETDEFYKSSVPIIFNDTEVHKFYDEIFKNLRQIRNNENLNPVKFNVAEILTRTNDLDYGIGLQHGLKSYAVNNSEMTNIDLGSQIERAIYGVDKTIDEIKEEDTCSTYVLAKKYIDLQELEDDNLEPDIYFDNQYDETRYSILLEYKNEHNTMSREDFIEFLVGRLMESVGLTRQMALREANAIYDGKRKVEDGDWAVLEVNNDEEKGPELMYYERRSGKWEYDPSGYKEKHNLSTIKQSEFCENNPEQNCYKDGSECKDGDILNAELNKQLLNNMLDEIKREYKQNLDDFKKQIRDDMDDYYYYGNVSRNKSRYLKLYDIYNYNNIKHNLIKSYIGGTLEERNVIQSPWQKLFNIILGQSDFIKKQHDIIRFANKYTKDDKTNQYMLVCKDTGIPLVPTFMIELANAATGLSSISYEKTLERICKEERATISDSGDAYVDKYSGYIIKYIEFSTEEGYEESGYKYVSREVLEKDLGETLIQATTGVASMVYTDIKSKMVSNVFRAMCDQMNIILDNELDFVVSSTTDAINKKIPSQEEHKVMEEKMRAKGKRYPSYSEYTNAILMYYTLANTLIAIQSAIPSVKTKKTFPGCVKSFKGYPVHDDLDMSAITYIACVANTIKSSADPWSAIKGKNTTTEILVKQIKTALDDILKNSNVRQKIQTKRDYLAIKPDEFDDIPEELRINRWTTFLPPLNRIELESSTKKDITPEFKNSLLEAAKSGNETQVEKINTLLSKLYYYSLAIQESIQKSIDKEDLALKTNNGIPFMENVCCNDGSVDTFKYFNEKTDGDIAKYIKMTNEIKKIYDDYMKIVKPVYYIRKEDTKLRYPSVSESFGEDTIYSAFIHYCKFNKNIPLNDSLMSICLSNKSSFKVNDNLKTKIDTLKSEGRVFTVENFNTLLDIINRQNLIKIDLSREAETQKQRLANLLDGQFSKLPASQFSSALVKLLIDLIEQFDKISRNETDETITDDLYNFLYEQSRDMKTNIIQYIKRYAGTYNKSSVEKFLNELTVWETTKNPITLNDQDETNYKVIDNLRQYMSRLCCELPMSIVNKVSYETLNIPTHWDLSEKHNNELSTMINELTDKLKMNYVDMGELDEGEIDTDDNVANRTFNETLRGIKERTKHIYSLMQNTPINVSNSNKKPIVGTELIVKLHEYYVLNVFSEYISIAIEKNSILLNEKIAKLLVTYIDVLSVNKTKINMNKEDIMAQVLRSKEVEKKEITDYLAGLSTEKRKVENIFKNSKLGDKWSLGLTEAVYKYDPDVYDKEMEAATKRVVADVRGEGISEDIAEQEVAMMEEYNMSGMANDDEYADGLDGDEAY